MLTALSEANLSTYFILPLIGLSKHDFGEGNCKDTFLGVTGDVIYVAFKDATLLPENTVGVLCVTAEDGTQYLRYGIPSMWAPDVAHYMNGKYGNFSEEAKQLIHERSGLANRVEKEGLVYTDFRLLALLRSPILVEEWKSHLYDPKDMSVLDMCDMDLLPKPVESNYFTKEVINMKTL